MPAFQRSTVLNTVLWAEWSLHQCSAVNGAVQCIGGSSMLRCFGWVGYFLKLLLFPVAGSHISWPLGHVVYVTNTWAALCMCWCFLEASGFCLPASVVDIKCLSFLPWSFPPAGTGEDLREEGRRECAADPKRFDSFSLFRTLFAMCSSAVDGDRVVG